MTERMKVLHLSDLHLTDDGADVFGANPATRLQQAIQVIVREHADAAFCLLTGDLADRGGVAAYAWLQQQLQRLPMPCYLLPGNHDDRANLRAVFTQTPVDAHGYLQQRVSTPLGSFLLLDTLQHGVAHGEYGADRLEWLQRTLATLDADEPLWLVMHHPPLQVGIPSMDQYALRNAEPLACVLEPYRPRIRHLLVGHVHRAIGGSWRGWPFSCVRSPNHQVALDLHTRGADVPGSHEAPGFGVILADGRDVVVHHQDFLVTGAPFWI